MQAKGGRTLLTSFNYCDLLITFHVIDDDIMPVHVWTISGTEVVHTGVIEASNLCASQVFRGANASTQLCCKASSLGQDNIYADISKLKLAATPETKRKCGRQTTDFRSTTDSYLSIRTKDIKVNLNGVHVLGAHE